MTQITLENLGFHLKENRGNQTIREMAKKMDISHSTLSRIENGKMPDMQTLKKICKYLNFNVDQVMIGKQHVRYEKEIVINKIRPPISKILNLLDEKEEVIFTFFDRYDLTVSFNKYQSIRIEFTSERRVIILSVLDLKVGLLDGEFNELFRTLNEIYFDHSYQKLVEELQ